MMMIRMTMMINNTYFKTHILDVSFLRARNCKNKQTNNKCVKRLHYLETVMGLVTPELIKAVVTIFKHYTFFYLYTFVISLVL